jgi:undecaprenyl-diphosphatase
MKNFFLTVFWILIPLLFFAQNADIDLLREINLNRNKALDPFLRGITHTAGPVAFVVPLLLLVVASIKKNRKLKRKAVIMVISVLTAVIVTTTLKYTINRPRPFETYSFIEKVTSGGSPSFPSGHTTDAFVLATALSLAFPRRHIIWPAFLWATAIAYSRMSLGVHYPADVLVGILIGTGAALLWHIIFSSRQESRA